MKHHSRRKRPSIRAVIASGLAVAVLTAALVPAQVLAAADGGTQVGISQLKQSSLELLVSSMTGSVESNVKAQAKAEQAAEIEDTGQQAVSIARTYLGVRYVSGGASPAGFDCSGLTMYVYAQLGISLPHNAQRQYYSVSTKVARSELQAGDLVFFGSSTSSIRHVGIYVGDGKYLHAPQTGESVKVSSLSSRSDYVGAVRPAS